MLNKIEFQGRLVADPELKKTQSDVSRLEFTVAWSEKYKEMETKCFLRCIAWRSTADFISNHFRKGQEIIIEGKMITEQWKDENGENKSRTVCLVDKAHFCGPKSDSSMVGNQDVGNGGFTDIPDNVDDSGLPFNF